jgi:hypothetical protein
MANMNKGGSGSTQGVNMTPRGKDERNKSVPKVEGSEGLMNKNIGPKKGPGEF